jgi:glutamine amidotransferase
MAHLTRHGLDDAIREATQRGKPFLGICLGMQLLADHHEEGEVAGLRLFRGEVRRIPHGPKIPHMGWNQMQPVNAELPIFAHIPSDAYFYFAHSYYVEPQDQQGVAAVTDYGSPYCSVIVTDQVWGTQFHPEKSGTVGLQLLKNFVKWVRS